jgi:hypothetical protein
MSILPRPKRRVFLPPQAPATLKSIARTGLLYPHIVFKLREHGPQTKEELVARLKVSAEGLDNALALIQHRNWAIEVGRKIQLTRMGREAR